MSDAEFVSVQNLAVSYGRLTAVKGISFAIPRGAVFGFIGPNGAGKSSTIRVLATLQRPSVGRVRIAGIDVVKDPKAVRRRLGYVPDSFGIYEDLLVAEYLSFFAAAYGIPGAKREAIIRDCLALTDLSGKIMAPVEGLSRGMKQRLAIARVLLHDPELLLLDEPASGLDPRARIDLRELLKELQGMGKTILISSHILHELAQLCSHIAIIEAGKLMAQGDLPGIFAQLRLHRVVHVQAVAPPPELLAGLRAVPGVAQVVEEADRWAVHLEEAVLAVEDLHARLVGLGARLRMFQPEALDMETAFMKLTTGKTA